MTAKSRPNERLDPTTLAVLANRLQAIARETAQHLMLAGRSSIISIAHDFSTSIIGPNDELITSNPEGHPSHVMGTVLETPWMRHFHPHFSRGDAFLHNDPYIGGTHHADFTIMAPVFYEDQHVFTVCAKAHQTDCGNHKPTTYDPVARDIFDEGSLNFPCVQLQRDFKDIDDIIRMCRRRIRIPEIWYGDYLAQMSAVRAGERMLEEIVSQYGIDVVKLFIDEWMAYSEQVTIEAIAKLPAGRATATTRHDAYPGIPDGIDITAHVEVKPDEGVIEVDLRDNPDSVPAGVNLTESTATGNALIGVFNVLDEVPANSGSQRRVRVLLRDGCVVGRPIHPTSASMATTNVADRLTNATHSALAEIWGGGGLAEGGVGMGPAMSVITGNDPRKDGSEFQDQLFLPANGGPGTAHCDGWLTYVVPGGGGHLYRDSIEVSEQKYPLIFWRNSILPDSGGVGKFRGAPAHIVEFGPLKGDLTASYTMDAQETPVMGVRGGGSGAQPHVWKRTIESQMVELPATNDGERLSPGEVIITTGCGGGGFGSPLERDPEAVLHDVIEGWVTREQATRCYGVEFVESEIDAVSPLSVDDESTRQRRSALRDAQ